MVTLKKQKCKYYGYQFLQQICTVTHLFIHIQNLSLFIVAMTHILYCLKVLYILQAWLLSIREVPLE